MRTSGWSLPVITWTWIIISFLLMAIPGFFQPVSAEELFDRKKAEAIFNQGLTLYFEKSYESAVQAFEASSLTDPDFAAPHYFAGYAYYKLRDMKKARMAFEQAFEIDRRYSPFLPDSEDRPAQSPSP